LGLLGLVLRDLNDGWFAIGFGKSRGLGNVSVEYHSAIVQYPGCILRGDNIHPLGKSDAKPWHKKDLLGAGEFLGANKYGFPHSDKQSECPVSANSSTFGFGVEMNWPKQYGVEDLFRRAVENWTAAVQAEGAIR